MKYREKLLKKPVLLSLLLFALAGCSPDIGSKEWCDNMKEKPKGEWTGNEIKDYTKYCLFN